MYVLLADTYNLTADEQTLLDELGAAGYDEDCGTQNWAMRVTRLERVEVLDELCRKLNANYDELVDFALWYRTGICHTPSSGRDDLAMCPPPPVGCRTTKSIGMFPFWPVDVRCCDCIRDSVQGKGQLVVKQEIAGAKLRLMLRSAGAEHASVPQISSIVGAMVTSAGGVDGLVAKWTEVIEDLRESDPKAAANQYLQLTRMIEACNQIQRDEQSILDKLKDEELKDYIVRLLMQRMSLEQIREILSEAKGLPQAEVGRLSYGQA